MAVAVESEWSEVGRGVADVVASVPGWWEARARAAGLPPPWRDWRRALPPPPVPLDGSPVAALEAASPTALGEAYVSALEPPTRLREGRHYTPELLATALWQEIGRAGHEAGPVVDPACGAGALLLPPLRALVATDGDPETTLAHVVRSIRGTDTDAVAVWLGNAILAAELLPLWTRVPESRRRPLPRLLSVGDGLATAADRPSVVAMNPPYGRVRLVASERERWRETLFGHANRYALFLHAAIERAAPRGLVAAVVPTSFLGGAYYRRLRDFAGRRAPLERLVFVDARTGVFVGGVVQETCLAIFRKADRPERTACSRLDVNGSARVAPLSRVPTPRGNEPWLLPRTAADAGLVRAAARLRMRLADYGWRASTGPLVWNRHKPRIHATAGEGRLPILWAADVDGGAVRRDPARDRQRWFAPRPEDAFMALRAPAILVQRTTAPEQPRRLVAARLDAAALAEWGGAVVVENHVNVLRCSDPASPLTPELLVRLLRTSTFDRLYRCLTGTVAVSAYELESLPLPPPETIAEWRSLPADELDDAVAAYYEDAAP